MNECMYNDTPARKKPRSAFGCHYKVNACNGDQIKTFLNE